MKRGGVGRLCWFCVWGWFGNSGASARFFLRQLAQTRNRDLGLYNGEQFDLEALWQLSHRFGTCAMRNAQLVERVPTWGRLRNGFLFIVPQHALSRLLLFCCAGGLAGGVMHAAERLEYNRDVRPILADKCFACHGPDSAARKADLRLDQREAAIGMGAIVPEKPDESEILRRVSSADPAEVMPPPETKKSLSDAEREILRRWISEGAEYQLHWSFLPAQRPAVPDVTVLADGRHAQWPRQPLDAFVLQPMLAAGLEPAAEADKPTLARRVSLDLTGLPPAPELVAAFLADTSPEAYEKLVDQLLTSQAWGEHRGRYWLDYARYADTHGIHFDNFREMWSYRDWVIRAFNNNMPFDQFTIENLAGDLLPNATLDQRIGSGFNRCNMTTNEGGIIDEEYAVLYARDRTETTAQVWLGLTAGCAVCHSHKFDPLSQKEFYELSAFFNNTTQRVRDGNVKDTPPIVVVPKEMDRTRWDALPALITSTQQQIAARREAARSDFATWLASVRPEQLALNADDQTLILHAELKQAPPAPAAAAEQTEKAAATPGQAVNPQPAAPQPAGQQPAGASGAPAAVPADAATPEAGAATSVEASDKPAAEAKPAEKPAEPVVVTTPVLVSGEVRQVPLTDKATWREGPHGKAALQVSGSALELADAGDFEGDQAWSCAAWLHLPANDGAGAIAARMDTGAAFQGWDFWLQRRQVGMHIISAWPEKALKVVAKAQVPADRWVHVAVSYDGSGKASGVKVYYDGEPQGTDVENDKLSGSIRTSVPFRIGQRSSSDLFQGGLHDLRIYRRELTPGDVRKLARQSRLMELVSKDAAARSEKETEELFVFWLGEFDQASQMLNKTLSDLQREQADIQARGTIAHVMAEKETPAVAYVLFRGEYDQRRDQVAPNTPAVFPAFPAEFPRNRLGFAQWLLLPENPLTARVTVNRFWQEVFGNGIVKSAGDFGVSGQLPSHPELLDWLAVEFRESGWNVKRLFKTMVMSATYRQAAIATPAKLERDPENRLLARGPRFRMDAEMVRDYALAASGLLVTKLGGPSVKPYQPDGVWEAIAMNVSNTRSYVRDSGDNLYRRSLYTFVKRMAPPASLELFNAPNRELCTVQRERTNTPLQALVTLNDVQYVEAARQLAQKALQSGGDTFEGRLEVVSQRLLGRSFRPAEREIIHASFDQLAAYYQAHPEDAAALVAFGESKADPQLDAIQLAAWTMLANQLLNLDEVLNK